MDKYQKESSTFQLGWHSENSHIFYRQTHKILLKKKSKRYIQTGGLDKTLTQKRKTTKGIYNKASQICP